MPATTSIQHAENEFHRRLPELLPRLRRFALTLTRSPSAADDLVQIGCERALSRLSQWNPDTRLDSWMFRIMQTMWLNQLRAQKVRERHADVAAQQPSAFHSEDPERRLVLIRAEQEILKLPDDLRLVLVLACVEGFSYQETADTLSIPLGTVMSRLARARLLLMERLGQQI